MKKIYCLILLAAMVASCKKAEMVVPPSVAEFLTKVNTDTYYIQNSPASVYKIPIGVTTVATQDRVINYTITSPTGATAGTHYSIASSGSITIPAGKAVDTIVVRGLFAGYNAPRKDTLVFRITGGDFEPLPAPVNLS
jgi:flagellar capping protein FliD